MDACEKRERNRERGSLMGVHENRERNSMGREGMGGWIDSMRREGRKDGWVDR